MGYKKHPPVSVKKMMNPRYHGHHTVCQKLREIFVKTQDEEIKLMCREAMAMAKAMHDKLKYYRKKESERLNG